MKITLNKGEAVALCKVWRVCWLLREYPFVFKPSSDELLRTYQELRELAEKINSPPVPPDLDSAVKKIQAALPKDSLNRRKPYE